MKKSLTVAAVFLSCILNIHALDNLHFNVLGNEYAFTVETHIGVSNLKMTETVYNDSSSGDFLSEIDWDIGAQLTAGTGLNIAPVDLFKKTGFSSGGNVLWYFPVNDRTMKDYDWDDAGNKYGYGESMEWNLEAFEKDWNNLLEAASK